MLWNRSSGSFARHVFTTESSTGGVMVRMLEITGGSAARIAAIVEAVVLPSNARLPVHASYSTAPSEKMSERRSASLPSSCSGDMYWKVPTTVPRWVRGWLAAGVFNVAVKLESAGATAGVAL